MVIWTRSAAGMSGAVVVTGDDRVVGVVRSHAVAEGVGSLTITPLAAIDFLPKQTAEALWGTSSGMWVAQRRSLEHPAELTADNPITPARNKAR